jgi:hypothetical protein
MAVLLSLVGSPHDDSAAQAAAAPRPDAVSVLNTGTRLLGAYPTLRVYPMIVDPDRDDVRAAEETIELAADVIPVLIRIEPGVSLGHEGGDYQIQRSKVWLDIQARQVALVKRPSLALP